MCAGACVAAHGEGFVGYPPPPFPSSLLMAGSGEATSSSPQCPQAQHCNCLHLGGKRGAYGERNCELWGGHGIPGTSPAPQQGLTFTKEVFPLFPPLSSFPFSSRKTKLQWFIAHRAWAREMPCQQPQPWRAGDMLSLRGNSLKSQGQAGTVSSTLRGGWIYF